MIKEIVLLGVYALHKLRSYAIYYSPIAI